MNRIYQGKVTNVEIANPDKHAPRILSASTGERTEVRCRNQDSWLPFADDPKQAKAKWQSALPVPSKPGEDGWQHHQLFQDAVN
ncbi:MAG: hypothetical protein HYY24_05235 [Verrucomicrobia bacterium]|nr:hypothetical protein [Verrucomicrobiota bacterium]